MLYWKHMSKAETREHLLLLAANLAIIAAAFEVPAYQIMYAGAFSFFAAVSLMFLAFGKLRGFGGIYKDLQEEEAKP